MSDVQRTLSVITVTKNDGDQLIVAEDRRADPVELLPGTIVRGEHMHTPRPSSRMLASSSYYIESVPHVGTVALERRTYRPVWTTFPFVLPRGTGDLL